jgi:hypothetical protein
MDGLRSHTSDRREAIPGGCGENFVSTLRRLTTEPVLSTQSRLSRTLFDTPGNMISARPPFFVARPARAVLRPCFLVDLVAISTRAGLSRRNASGDLLEFLRE